MPKLNRHAREKRKTAGVCEVSQVGGKAELWRKEFVEKMSLSREWKRGVMDGDSGDEGNDELTRVKSDESDKSS